MDLELMSSLCMANWVIWTKFFTDLLALVLAYAVSILTAISFTFFQGSELNTFTFISLCLCHVLMAKIFSFQLLYHTCLIKLTSLQVYHCTSLIKLTNITSLQHNYNMFQIDITSLYNSITLFSFYPFTDSFTFSTSAFAIYFCFTRSKVCCIFHLQLHMEHFEIATSFRWLIQVHNHLIKIQCFAPYAPTKLTVVFSKIWHLLALMKTAMHDVIKPVMVYLSAKLVMRKFWSLYHLEIPSTWHRNRQNCYPTCSSLRTSKSSFCYWKILLRLQKSYLHSLCRSCLLFQKSILW